MQTQTTAVEQFNKPNFFSLRVKCEAQYLWLFRGYIPAETLELYSLAGTFNF